MWSWTSAKYRLATHTSYPTSYVCRTGWGSDRVASGGQTSKQNSFYLLAAVPLAVLIFYALSKFRSRWGRKQSGRQNGSNSAPTEQRQIASPVPSPYTILKASCYTNMGQEGSGGVVQSLSALRLYYPTCFAIS